MTPVRLQRSRQRGARLTSPNGLRVVCVTRGTKWGNPFPVGKAGPWDRVAPDAEGSVGFFIDMLRDEQIRDAAGYPSVDEIRRELHEKNLACWCGTNERWCHADVLLKIANETSDIERVRKEVGKR